MECNKLARITFALLAVALTTLMTPVPANAVTEIKVLHAFGIANGDGDVPNSGLIADAIGNLYGTTSSGGAYGFGTVFQLTPTSNGLWNETILYSFKGGNDGNNPSGELVFDGAGNLYGVMWAGGVVKGSITQGCGTLFELTPNAQGSAWVYTVIYSFQCGPDGVGPLGPLVFDSSGNLYGVTELGGSSNFGTVFKLSASQGAWTKSVLYDFLGGADGTNPGGGLTLDSSGNIYGTTTGLNGEHCGHGAYCGLIFELALSSGSWTEEVLYTFRGGLDHSPDGTKPSGGLILDSSGNLYGMTSGGGASHICAHGCGTIFKLTRNASGSWSETTIYAFHFNKNDGAYPTGAMLVDSMGNLYGVTAEGGGTANCRNGCGTIFELSPGSGDTWTEVILYRFRGEKNGSAPNGGLYSDGMGNLYGTTMQGLDSSGVAFELTP